MGFSRGTLCCDSDLLKMGVFTDKIVAILQRLKYSPDMIGEG